METASTETKSTLVSMLKKVQVGLVSTAGPTSASKHFIKLISHTGKHNAFIYCCDLVDKTSANKTISVTFYSLIEGLQA